MYRNQLEELVEMNFRVARNAVHGKKRRKYGTGQEVKYIVTVFSLSARVVGHEGSVMRLFGQGTSNFCATRCDPNLTPPRG